MPSLFASSSSSSTTSVALPNLQFSPAKNIVNPSWLDFGDRTSVDRTVDSRSFLRGIDVNRLPANADEEEEPVVSSPNSTISSVSGKQREREITVRDASSAGDKLDLDEEDGDTSRKKLRLSKDQSTILEESFKEHNTLNPIVAYLLVLIISCSFEKHNGRGVSLQIH